MNILGLFLLCMALGTGGSAFAGESNSDRSIIVASEEFYPSYLRPVRMGDQEK